MTSLYSNVPPKSSSIDAEIQVSGIGYSESIELPASTLVAIQGFFTSRGFADTASQSIAVIIIQQAKRDGYNPMKILDTLSGLDAVAISALVSEILNYNRIKTSFLGYASQTVTNHEVARNIIL